MFNIYVIDLEMQYKVPYYKFFLQELLIKIECNSTNIFYERLKFKFRRTRDIPD